MAYFRFCFHTARHTRVRQAVREYRGSIRIPGPHGVAHPISLPLKMTPKSDFAPGRAPCPPSIRNWPLGGPRHKASAPGDKESFPPIHASWNPSGPSGTRPPGRPPGAQFPKTTALLRIFTPRRDDDVRPWTPIPRSVYDQLPRFACVCAFDSQPKSSSDTKPPPVMRANHDIEPRTPADNVSHDAMRLGGNTCTIYQCEFCRLNSRASTLLVWRHFMFW